ncbi:non-homologous end-joining DNA ligase [Bacillus sp. E214]|uniref:non-homologous end-joining DNA ligase n=1 Tax=Bacillus sp. E214 TaxID=2587156 RepID=UPI0011DFBDDA|nr:non-homologous end-joining DNA ligase [Bacillus sp. E214]
MRYTGLCFLTKYDSENKVCTVAVLHEEKIIEVAEVKEAFTDEEREAILGILHQTGKAQQNQIYKVPPGICIQVAYKAVTNYKLNSPVYISLAVTENWTACTWTKLVLSQYEQVAITNPGKIIWTEQSVTKEMYLEYLLTVADFMLPFLKDRHLTVKRYPEGVDSQGFYQKATPDYAPDFVKTDMNHDINYTVCNNIETLLWLGNQAAIEFHIPFNDIKKQNPAEIVFDLDPPELGDLRLAVKAALEMKQILDQFQLTAFVKLSGRKGIQIHLPLKGATISYAETRIFTEFIALYLINRFPDNFTIERMKKNRANRLYIDYIQHDKDKTIICPYSPRETAVPSVAAPLFWDEVKSGLQTEHYSMKTVKDRLVKGMNPFENYFTVDQSNQMKKIIDFIKKEHKP